MLSRNGFDRAGHDRRTAGEQPNKPVGAGLP
jgi:hypothetical protein